MSEAEFLHLTSVVFASREPRRLVVIAHSITEGLLHVQFKKDHETKTFLARVFRPLGAWVKGKTGTDTDANECTLGILYLLFGTLAPSSLNDQRVPLLLCCFQCRAYRYLS